MSSLCLNIWERCHAWPLLTQNLPGEGTWVRLRAGGRDPSALVGSGAGYPFVLVQMKAALWKIKTHFSSPFSLLSKCKIFQSITHSFGHLFDGFFICCLMLESPPFLLTVDKKHLREAREHFADSWTKENPYRYVLNKGMTWWLFGPRFHQALGPKSCHPGKSSFWDCRGRSDTRRWRAAFCVSCLAKGSKGK